VPSFTAAWTAAAALTAAYAPAASPEHPPQRALGGTDPASDAALPVQQRRGQRRAAVDDGLLSY
jgi:hypothetical protein